MARTQETLDALRDELERNCGDFYGACKVVGVSPGFVRRWMAEDQAIDAALNEAKSVGHLGLVHAATLRATGQVTKDVYYQGEVVGQEKIYSDGLLSKLLTAYQPEFAAGGGTTVNLNLGNIIQTMPRASNYQEWLAMQEKPALPAPDDFTEFSECLPAPELDPAMADIL